ncbi:ABC transporter permease [Lachnospiraceae bacterium OttesenSCG-928-D06]|nr:ABC transporter permease [Lachnospiraceae bacterium OttesenSCG-928-D06]
MYNLMKLELRKTRIHPYIWASAIIALCMLGMLYTFSAVSHMGSEADAIEFSSYYNIMVLTNALMMVSFSVLAAVMLTTFVIKDYSGKNAILLFSYPLERKTLLLSKVFLVSAFTVISLLLSTIAIYVVWGLTESFFPLVDDSFSISLIANAARDTLCMAVISIAISLIALNIGFRKKSISTTIVSAVIICTIPANLVVAGTSSVIIIVALTLVLAIAGLFSLLALVKNVSMIEV